MAAERELDLEALRQDVARLRDDLSKLTESTRDIARGGAETLRARLEGNAQHLRHEAERVYDEGRQRGQNAVESLERTIGERPVTSLLTAFGLGLVLGAFLNRR
jgi:ElaB/YqjD/DUF883 family membrane-anchored ribosome-binding protein